MAHTITDTIYVILLHHGVLKLFIRGSFLFPLEMYFLKDSITFKKDTPLLLENKTQEKNYLIKKFQSS